MFKRIVSIALCVLLALSGAVYADELKPEKYDSTVKTLISKGVRLADESQTESFPNNSGERLSTEGNADTRYDPYIPEGSTSAYRVKYGNSKLSLEDFCYYGYIFASDEIGGYDLDALSLSMYIMPMRSTTNSKFVAVNQSLYNNFEIGLLCKSHNDNYSSVRVKISDYIPVPSLPVAKDASWYRLEIPFSEILSNGTFYNDLGDGLSEFDAENICGVRFATKPDTTATNAFVFAMVDELKIVQSVKKPYDLVCDASETSSVTFSWSDDNKNADGYNIFRDDVYIANTTEKTFTDNGLKPLTEYTYKVQTVCGGSRSETEEIKITTADYFSDSDKYDASFKGLLINGSADLSSAYLESGNLKISGNVKSNTFSGKLFAAAAYYEENRMKDFAVSALECENGGEKEFSLDLNAGENGYVKFFVIDKFDSLNILSQVCVLDKNGLYILDGENSSDENVNLEMDFDANKSEFNIGKIPSGLSAVMLAEESVNLSEIDETNAEEKVAYINVPYDETNENGKFAAAVNSEKFADGYYVAYLRQKGGGKVFKSEKKYFASQSTISNIYGVVNNENASESDIINAVTNPVLAFDLTDYNRVKGYEKSIARLIKEYGNGSINSADELNKVFEKATGTVVMMTVANIADMQKYAEILSLDEETVKILNSDDTPSSIKSAAFELMRKTNPSAEDITYEKAGARFKESYICAAASSGETTWAELEKLITKHNLADLSKITDEGLEKSDVLKEMLEKSYTVYADFETRLSSAITTVKQNASASESPKRSGSGGGGGGMKVSTPVVPPADDANNTENNGGAESKTGIFADLPTSHWAYSSVLNLVNKNIISKDENFRPNDYITREEFAKIIAVVFEPVADKIPDFDDVDKDSWYMPYINSVYSANLVKGISENKFGVGLNITREDMAVIIFRALGAEDTEYDINFADKENISDYAENAVGYLNQNGLLNGDNGRVYAKNNATRAECCVLINNLLLFMNK